MVFKTVLEQPSTVSSSNTPDSTRQLINRDFKIWSGSEKVKSWEKICVSDPLHVQQQQKKINRLTAQIYIYNF